MNAFPRRRALALGLMASGALAGCARIPGDGPTTVVDLTTDVSGSAPYVQPQPPAPGATPAQIVESFLQAGLSREDDSAIAREHLAEPLRTSWNPQDRVLVYSADDDIALSEVADGTVRIEGVTMERIDAQGVRERLAAPEAFTATVELTQVDGEWRILSAPPGVLVSDAVFSLLFSPVRLYFLDPTRAHLVPDLRWFPAQSQAAAVLSALAAGPSDLLRPTVLSAIPESRAVADAPLVQASDGALRVLLPAEVERLEQQRRTEAIEQIRASLTSVSVITTVHVALADQDAEQATSPAVPRPGHRPLGAGESGVVSLSDPAAGTAAVQLVPDLADVEVSVPVISADGRVAAALSAAGTRLHIAAVGAAVPLRTIAMEGPIAAPRVDSRGWVWAVPQAADGIIRVYALGGEDRSFAVPWLEGRTVRSIDIAPDGVRVLVLSVRDGGTRLDGTAVLRDEAGAPMGLSAARTIPTGMHGELQANWSDELRVLLLGIEDETGTAQVTELDLLRDSRSGTLAPARASRVAGTALSEYTWASTVEGDLLRSNGREWEPMALAARDPWVY